MGLLHNGDVSAAGFWIAAERWLLNTSVRQWCSPTYWIMFRDDIFAITSNFPRLKHVFSWLRSRAALEGYKLLAEDFLGCRCLGGQWLFCDETESKDCCPLLSEYSAHPRHVHISWPCCVARSFGSICLHRKEQRAAGNDFLARLQRRPRVIKDKPPKNTTWLVLDPHPLYRTGRVSRAVRKMFQDPF